jgi:hypothetical protein
MIKDPELLKLAVKAIEAEPERWNQAFWGMGRPKSGGTVTVEMKGIFSNELFPREFSILDLDNETCGTTMCLAGHVVTQAGFPLLLRADGWGDADDRGEAGRCLVDGKAVSISEKAQELLGLTDGQAAIMFTTGNMSLPEFKEKLTELTEVEFE